MELNLFQVGGLAAFLVMTVQDIRTKYISVWIPIVVGTVGVVSCLCRDSREYFSIGVSVAIVVFFGLVSMATRGQFGLGDVAAMGLIGLMWSPWQTMAIIYLSFVVAFLFAVYLRVFKKKGKKYGMPFVPCLFIAQIIVTVL